MTSAVYGNCATCGASLAPPDGVTGIYTMIHDNKGDHHYACWAAPRPPAWAIDRLARAVMRVADRHLEFVKSEEGSRLLWVGMNEDLKELRVAVEPFRRHL